MRYEKEIRAAFGDMAAMLMKVKENSDMWYELNGAVRVLGWVLGEEPTNQMTEDVLKRVRDILKEKSQFSMN